MNIRSIARSGLLAFVIFSLGWWAGAEVTARSVGKSAQTTSPKTAPDNSRKVIAYYFHGNVRCQSCLDIERFSQDAIQEGFPGEIYGGLLEYRVVNVQTPENRHFFDDYGLTSWALVLVDYREGRQTKWKNLDKVWELVLGDPSKFHDYVKGEVKAFLAGEG